MSCPGAPRSDAVAYNLPIDGYQRLTVDEVVRKARMLDPGDLKRIRAFEAKHSNRKTLLTRIDELMHPTAGAKRGSSRPGIP